MCFFKLPTRFLAAAFILLVVPLCVSAQPADATVRGVIVDQMGASIPRARIVIANRSVTRELQSDQMGEFVSTVPSGVYRITIQIPGFRVARLNRVRVQPGLLTPIKVVMKARPVKYGKCPKGPPCIWL